MPGFRLFLVCQKMLYVKLLSQNIFNFFIQGFGLVVTFVQTKTKKVVKCGAYLRSVVSGCIIQIMDISHIHVFQSLQYRFDAKMLPIIIQLSLQ